MSIRESSGEGSFFHCFTCGASGDVFTFLSRREHLSFPQAVQKAADMLLRHPRIAVPLASSSSSSLSRAAYPFTRPSPHLSSLYPGKLSPDNSSSIEGTGSRMPDGRAKPIPGPELVVQQAAIRSILKLAADHYREALTSDSVGAFYARKYLTSRGVSPATAAHFMLGFAPYSSHWDRYMVSRMFNSSLSADENAAAEDRGVPGAMSRLTAFRGYKPSSATALVLEQHQWNISIVPDVLSSGLATVAQVRSDSGANLTGGGPLLNNPIYDTFRNRLMFPICDSDGHVIGFGGRILPDGSARFNTSVGKFKYVNSPTSPVFRKKETLFALSSAKDFIRQSDQAIIVEGYMDVVSLFELGFRNVVASLGTALSVEHLLLAANCSASRTVVLLLDNDEAGHHASRRAAALYAKHITNRQKPAQRAGGRPATSYPSESATGADLVRIKVGNLSMAADLVRSKQGNRSVVVKDVSDIHMAFDRRLAREIVDYVLREAMEIEATT